MVMVGDVVVVVIVVVVVVVAAVVVSTDVVVPILVKILNSNVVTKVVLKMKSIEYPPWSSATSVCLLLFKLHLMGQINLPPL